MALNGKEALDKIAETVGAKKKGDSYFSQVTGAGSNYERRIKITGKGAIAQVKDTEAKKPRFENTPFRRGLSLDEVEAIIKTRPLTDLDFPMQGMDK